MFGANCLQDWTGHKLLSTVSNKHYKKSKSLNLWTIGSCDGHTSKPIHQARCGWNSMEWNELIVFYQQPRNYWEFLESCWWKVSSLEGHDLWHNVGCPCSSGCQFITHAHLDSTYLCPLWRRARRRKRRGVFYIELFELSTT